jgi:UDP-N-acetylmuramoyl-tripeptide--D-alanyl-D-alanine ligase
MFRILKKIVVAILFVEARITLWAHRPHIVGITGSVGKTSTKDAIASVAQKLGSVRKSAKSYNSELGLPLTILGLTTAWKSVCGWFANIARGLYVSLFSFSYPEWLVLELGVDRPGDMDVSVSLVPLDVAVIMHVGENPVHVEFFNSPQELLAEKVKIIHGLSSNGVLILSNDDEQIRALKSRVKQKTITFGISEGSDVCGDYYAIIYGEDGRPVGMTFKVLYDGNVVPLSLYGIVGRQSMYAFLAAVAFGISHGLNLVEISEALVSREMAPGRMRLLDGILGSTIIDDTYNSSPMALANALSTLEEISGEKKIAILGDMAELGPFSEKSHQLAMGKCAGVDVLVTVGAKMREASEYAKKAGIKQIESFENSRDAGLFVKSIIKKGDVVLCKGSQSMRIERAVAELLAHPQEVQKLLVRQDREWDKR